MPVGSGALDVSAILSPRFVGGQAELSYRAKSWLSAYASGRYGYDPINLDRDYLVLGGLRGRW